MEAKSKKSNEGNPPPKNGQDQKPVLDNQKPPEKVDLVAVQNFLKTELTAMSALQNEKKLSGVLIGCFIVNDGVIDFNLLTACYPYGDFHKTVKMFEAECFKVYRRRGTGEGRMTP